MIIKFNWNGGWMEYDGDKAITDIAQATYRKWVKLFAKYGTSDQHRAFLERIKEIHHEEFQRLNDLLVVKNHAVGRMNFCVQQSAEWLYFQREAQATDQKINAVKRILKSYSRKYEILEGLLK